MPAPLIGYDETRVVAPEEDQALSMHMHGVPLFTIKPNGQIVRGPAFTTDDDMSLRFWEILGEAFPLFRAQLLQAAKQEQPRTQQPTAPGFYWAKWRIASEGTREADELTPSDDWEVVEVFENCINKQDPEYLMVFVPGVEKGQPLDGFVWGSGVLEPPQ